jgi:hypothetical protein
LVASLTLGIGSAQVDRIRVSAPSPFAACDIKLLPGEANYLNAEVEPRLAVNPRNPSNLVGVWQQDRFTSAGGSRGLVTGVSHNGGQTWERTFPHFSSCAGGNAQNHGNYERATDPWVTIAPNGVIHQIALSYDAVASAREAVLVSRSVDGGHSWSDPTPLILDTDPTVGDDKQSITADPQDAGFVYAVWDRTVTDSTLVKTLAGPTWFSRTMNGGNSWEPAHIIYDPGPDAQTISNQIVVLPNGNLVNLFVRILHVNEGSTGPGDVVNMVSISRNKGVTWSAPILVATAPSIGVVDPKTGDALRTGDSVPDIGVDQRTGALYVVWQDARFSSGKREGIAMARSSDGGLSWSAPIQVNRVPAVQAHTASVDVADDGSVGVTYYDFRKDTVDPSVFLSDYWEVHSRDGGHTWQERHLAGSFDMLTAPKDDGGLFLGDYQSLRHWGESFLPFFVATNSGNLKNRTDVFVSVSEEEESMDQAHEEVNVHPQSMAERLKAHRGHKRLAEK